MSQHDYNLADQLFPAMRIDMNNLAQAIVTKNAGDAAPGATFPFMWWIDTSSNVDNDSTLKIRNEPDAAWVTIGQLTNTVWTPFFQGAAMGNACTKTVGTNAGQLPPAESTLLLSGGTMVGALKLAGAPTDPLHAATKAYADGIVGVPTGVIAPFAGAAAPTGWLLCDGSAVSRATYAALFAVISTTYGAGDNVNTFNLPDLRDRTVYGNSVSKPRGFAGGSDFITTAQLPSHTHGITGPGGAGLTGFFGDHTHTFTTGTESVNHTHNQAGVTVLQNAGGSSVIGAGGTGTGIGGVTATENQLHTHSGTTNTSSIGDHAHQIPTATDAAGSGVQFLPKFLAVPYIIKT